MTNKVDEYIKDVIRKAYEAIAITDNASARLNNKRVFIYRGDIADKAFNFR